MKVCRSLDSTCGHYAVHLKDDYLPLLGFPCVHVCDHSRKVLNLVEINIWLDAA